MGLNKGGRVCAAINCKNKSYTCNKSFFMFPKDPVRARIWAMASNREDLLGKSDGLHGSHRLCGDHFDKKMFTNKFCNRLKLMAVPTIFPQLEGPSGNLDHNYSLPRLVIFSEANVEKKETKKSPKSIEIHQNICMNSDKEEKEITQQQEPLKQLQSNGTSSNSSVNTEDIILSPSPEMLFPSNSSTQTSSSLSFHTPRQKKIS